MAEPGGGGTEVVVEPVAACPLGGAVGGAGGGAVAACAGANFGVSACGSGEGSGNLDSADGLADLDFGATVGDWAGAANADTTLVPDNQQQSAQVSAVKRRQLALAVGKALGVMSGPVESFLLYCYSR